MASGPRERLPSGLVVLTGAGGFVGRAVLPLLAARGYRVRAVSRRPGIVMEAAHETVELPGDRRDARSFERLLEGASHVVHCAGLADAASGTEADHFEANAWLTGALAAAAARTISGKFVFLSSVRAVRGVSDAEVIDDRTYPRPEDAYGRSKLEGERLLRAAFRGDARFTILRPVPIYGEGMRGGLRQLLRLCRLPIPLPFGNIAAPRSLLDRHACAAAILHALDASATNGGAYLLSDRHPVSLAGIVAAFRKGLGRQPRLLNLPTPLLRAGLQALGKGPEWDRLSSPLVIDPGAFARTGWRPPEDTLDRLARAAAATAS